MPIEPTFEELLVWCDLTVTFPPSDRYGQWREENPNGIADEALRDSVEAAITLRGGAMIYFGTITAAGRSEVREYPKSWGPERIGRAMEREARQMELEANEEEP